MEVILPKIQAAAILVWEIPEIVSFRPSPSFYNANKTHLVRAANLFTAHKTRGCMPHVRRHTLKPDGIRRERVNCP